MRTFTSLIIILSLASSQPFAASALVSDSTVERPQGRTLALRMGTQALMLTSLQGHLPFVISRRKFSASVTACAVFWKNPLLAAAQDEAIFSGPATKNTLDELSDLYFNPKTSSAVRQRAASRLSELYALAIPPENTVLLPINKQNEAEGRMQIQLIDETKERQRVNARWTDATRKLDQPDSVYDVLRHPRVLAALQQIIPQDKFVPTGLLVNLTLRAKQENVKRADLANLNVLEALNSTLSNSISGRDRSFYGDFGFGRSVDTNRAAMLSWVHLNILRLASPEMTGLIDQENASTTFDYYQALLSYHRIQGTNAEEAYPVPPNFTDWWAYADVTSSDIQKLENWITHFYEERTRTPAEARVLMESVGALRYQGPQLFISFVFSAVPVRDYGVARAFLDKLLLVDQDIDQSDEDDSPRFIDLQLGLYYLALLANGPLLTDAECNSYFGEIIGSREPIQVLKSRIIPALAAKLVARDAKGKWAKKSWRDTLIRSIVEMPGTGHYAIPPAAQSKRIHILLSKFGRRRSSDDQFLKTLAYALAARYMPLKDIKNFPNGFSLKHKKWWGTSSFNPDIEGQDHAFKVNPHIEGLTCALPSELSHAFEFFATFRRDDLNGNGANDTSGVEFVDRVGMSAMTKRPDRLTNDALQWIAAVVSLGRDYFEKERAAGLAELSRLMGREAFSDEQPTPFQAYQLGRAAIKTPFDSVWLRRAKQIENNVMRSGSGISEFMNQVTEVGGIVPLSTSWKMYLEIPAALRMASLENREEHAIAERLTADFMMQLVHKIHEYNEGQNPDEQIPAALLPAFSFQALSYLIRGAADEIRASQRDPDDFRTADVIQEDLIKDISVSKIAVWLANLISEGLVEAQTGAIRVTKPAKIASNPSSVSRRSFASLFLLRGA